MNYIKGLIYWILSLQEKALTKKLKSNLQTVYTDTTTKRAYSKDYSMTLTSITERNKARLEYDIKALLKKSQNNPNSLLEFIEEKGTKVYKIDYANKILGFILEEEGLISAKKGLSALYLNLVISILAKEPVKISFKTEPMFVLRDLPVDSYYMIHQFHKWYAMKLNLPGFDYVAQENFKKFFKASNDDEMKSLNVNEILSLKEAIARDVEAINFVVELAKSTDGSKKAMKLITQEQGASV